MTCVRVRRLFHRQPYHDASCHVCRKTTWRPCWHSSKRPMPTLKRPSLLQLRPRRRLMLSDCKSLWLPRTCLSKSQTRNRANTMTRFVAAAAALFVCVTHQV